LDPNETPSYTLSHSYPSCLSSYPTQGKAVLDLKVDKLITFSDYKFYIGSMSEMFWQKSSKRTLIV